MNTTRRAFLQTIAAGSGVFAFGAAVPSFLVEALATAEARAGDRVLVVLQLTGGNDGLNTVIPYADDRYYRERPNLAIARSEVLKINDSMGLHPALRGLSDLLEQNQLAIVQGVGYPEPNRSHFESMDIWHTCDRKTQRRRTGWLGRYLDLASRQALLDVPALHLGADVQPLALAAEHVRVPSIASLDRFRLSGAGAEEAGKEVLQALRQRDSADNGLLEYVRTSTESALVTSERVQRALQQSRTDVSYPSSLLGQQLQTIAQLIDAGLPARIYYVQLDGFDTHAQQAAAHVALLSQLGGALAAFLQDLAARGHRERVLVMSFSEFGRRVNENASLGTDHGAAGPMLLAGGRVRAGLIGEHPSLEDLLEGDLKFHTDFRQVYATVLEDWLGVAESGKVLGGEYLKIDALV